VNRSLRSDLEAGDSAESVRAQSVVQSLDRLRHRKVRPDRAGASASLTSPVQHLKLDVESSPVRLSHSTILARPEPAHPQTVSPHQYDEARFRSLPRGFQPLLLDESAIAETPEADNRAQSSDSVHREPPGLANYASPTPDSERSRSPTLGSSSNRSWLDSGISEPAVEESSGYSSPTRSHSLENMLDDTPTASPEIFQFRAHGNAANFDVDGDDQELYSEVVRYVLSAEVASASLFRFSATLALLDASGVRNTIPLNSTTDEDADPNPFFPPGSISRADHQILMARELFERILEEDIRPCLTFPGSLSTQLWRYLNYEDAIPEGVSRNPSKTRPWPLGNKESRAVALAGHRFAESQESAGEQRDRAFQDMMEHLPEALQKNLLVVEPISKSMSHHMPSVGDHPCDFCSGGLPVAFFSPPAAQHLSSDDEPVADVSVRALRAQASAILEFAKTIRPRGFVVSFEDAEDEGDKWFICRWCRQRVVTSSNFFAFWRNVRKGVLGKTRSKAIYLQFLVLRMHMAHARIAGQI
jgi:hypothetical protein